MTDQASAPASAPSSTPAAASTPATPVSTPSTPSSPTPIASSADQFGQMGEDDLDDLDGINFDLPTSKAPADAAAPSPAAPVTEPAPAAAPAATDPAQSAAPPATPASAAPATPPATTEGDSSPPTAESALAELAARNEEIFKAILPKFAIPKELVQELEDDAVAATPKLLARTYMNAVETSLQYMQTLVPNMISRAIAQDRVAREAEGEFLKQFPLLDKTKHGNDIRAFAKAFRQAQPDIDKDSLLRQVGLAVMAKHGIVPTAAAPAASPSPAPAPASPAAPVAFSPAGVGARVVSSTPVDMPGREFAGLGLDLDET